MPETNPTAFCYKCKTEKSLSEFANYQLSGASSKKCRDCCKLTHRLYYEKNREAIIARTSKRHRTEAARLQKRAYEKRPETKELRRVQRQKESRRLRMRAWQKRYRQLNKEKISRWNRLHRLKPDAALKIKANSAVNIALLSRRIQRPSTCSKCGVHCKPEAHHHRGYAPEFWLDVQWLCSLCHKYEDRIKPRLGFETSEGI